MQSNSESHGTDQILREELLDLGTARRRFVPRRDNGKPIAPSTMWRWITRGIGSGTDNVRLEVVYVGATPKTSHEALLRFFAAVTKARLEKQTPGQPEMITASAAELQKAGLLT